MQSDRIGSTGLKPFQLGETVSTYLLQSESTNALCSIGPHQNVMNAPCNKQVDVGQSSPQHAFEAITQANHTSNTFVSCSQYRKGELNTRSVVKL